MIRSKKLALVVGTLMALAACSRLEPAAAPATTNPQAAPDRAAVVAAAKTLIGRTQFATLSTLGDDGAPQSRIVEPFPLEDEFTVWIATNGATRKVQQIEHDARMTLLYFDQQAPGYVSLAGRATIVRDPAEKAKRWKDSWVGLYKDRPRGDDYTLIRVTPATLEISSPTQKMDNDPVTWKPVTIALAEKEG